MPDWNLCRPSGNLPLNGIIFHGKFSHSQIIGETVWLFEICSIPAELDQVRFQLFSSEQNGGRPLVEQTVEMLVTISDLASVCSVRMSHKLGTQSLRGAGGSLRNAFVSRKLHGLKRAEHRHRGAGHGSFVAMRLTVCLKERERCLKKDRQAGEIRDKQRKGSTQSIQEQMVDCS